MNQIEAGLYQENPRGPVGVSYLTSVPKRWLDIVIAGPMSGIALATIGVWGRKAHLLDGGPWLYDQSINIPEELRPRAFWKIRTMVMGAYKQEAEVMKCGPTGVCKNAVKDPRIIPAMEWLRDRHVDEWPQFINALRGDISVVGPRPITCWEKEWLMGSDDGQIVYEQWRNAINGGEKKIKFGITGPYIMHMENLQERLDGDCIYMERATFFTDLGYLYLSAFRSRVNLRQTATGHLEK